MKYIDEYRDSAVVKRIVDEIKTIAKNSWTIMEVCGGQTHTICQYGLEELLPASINLVHGPGCPICVTPLEQIDKAIAIAQGPDVIFCSFGDMLRVPGSQCDLLDVKARGGDVRVVYSPLDCVGLARDNPDRKIVFFAVGFETTAPANAMAAWQAKKLGVNNFFLLCSQVTVPPALTSMLKEPDNNVQAFLAPGHVCAIMGWREYEPISKHYKVPIVVTGFEPADILEGILRAVAQLEKKQAEVENQYGRAVTRNGNAEAQALIRQVFEVIDRPWRGLGTIAKSGYKLSKEYERLDAEMAFLVEPVRAHESDFCIAGKILRGLKKPYECQAFGKQCTPEHPLGATMVSSEGTCSTYHRFGPHKADRLEM